MKLIRSSLLLFCLAATGWAFAGCGADSAPEPDQVLDRALSRDSLLEPPVGRAEVEVASLGFEDAVLERRLLAVDRATNLAIRRALAGSGPGRGARGLFGLVGDLSVGESTEVNGVPAERVSGSLDVDRLIDEIRPLADDSGDTSGTGAVPGIGELDQLDESLVAADFELFADDDGSLLRFDLTLALDDPENSLPPSRIRFSLTVPSPDSGQPGSP